MFDQPVERRRNPWQGWSAVAAAICSCAVLFSYGSPAAKWWWMGFSASFAVNLAAIAIQSRRDKRKSREAK